MGHSLQVSVDAYYKFGAGWYLARGFLPNCRSLSKQDDSASLGMRRGWIPHSTLTEPSEYQFVDCREIGSVALVAHDTPGFVLWKQTCCLSTLAWMLHGDLLRIEHAGGTSWRLLRSSHGHAPHAPDDDNDDDDDDILSACEVFGRFTVQSAASRSLLQWYRWYRDSLLPVAGRRGAWLAYGRWLWRRSVYNISSFSDQPGSPHVHTDTIITARMHPSALRPPCRGKGGERGRGKGRERVVPVVFFTPLWAVDVRKDVNRRIILFFIHSFIHFNSGSKTHKTHRQQTDR